MEVGASAVGASGLTLRFRTENTHGLCAVMMKACVVLNVEDYRIITLIFESSCSDSN